MACEEPKARELQAEGTKAEEPFQELSKEEPPKEEPRQEEPPKEEPAEEEPAKEEPAKEEPAKEEAGKEEASKAELAKEEAKSEAATAEKPQEAAPQAKKADGESSASQVVGGSWTRPKGPSPEDDVLLESWRKEGKLHVLEGVWCCVPYKVTVVVADGTESEAARGKAQEILDGVAKEAESIFSHFVDRSEVSTINKLGKDELHSPSLAMRKVLTAASTLNKMTRGLFDPAVLPLVRRFREGAEDISEVAAYSKWSMFSLTDEGLKKAHADAQLDLCGLAKGWAIDEMASRLKEAGYMASYVDWGGDIKVTGQHPAGRNWNVAVREPPSIGNIGAAEGAAESQHIAHIELRDGQAIATSGDYLQTTATGLSHIVDPRKGAPVKISGDTCASASVVCSSCMLADALATAAMAAGAVKDSRPLLDNFRGAQLKDPVLDYFLYSRTGPRVVRLREFSAEVAEQREDRLTRHDEAVVVVIGGGLAGISAAIEASKARAKVILLEKEPELGGNSAKATSGINACGTRVQRAAGVDDDGRFFERDTHVSAKGGQSQVGCVSVLSDKSADAIHWLIDELGVPLTALSQLGGHARKRTHRVPPRDDGTPVPVGYTIMQHARAAASGMDGIDVRTQCTVKRLLRDKDAAVEAIAGVEYVDKDGASRALKCDAVVITTGGFGFDHSEGSFMQKYRPDLVGVPTTNGSFATGDGLKLGEELGAHMIDMDKVQLHPTAFIDPKDPGAHTKYLGPEALRGSGGILLDQQGRRFVNELDLRSVVSNKILQHCDPYKMPDGTEYRPWAWCVLNEEAQEKFGKPMLMFYKDQVGLFQAVDGTTGLADLIACDEQNILDTLKDYAAAADQKICGKTGKVVFPSRMCASDKSFIVGRITPCIHYTMGGLEIGPCGEVLTRRSGGAVGRRTKVPRLFAAGECTGGVHGGNRLGGNSLLECVVFGRMAGERAATIKQPKVELLSSGEWEPLVLLEVRDTCSKYGHNTAVYRFMLHGSLQHTGLEVGRFIAIRGEVDGDTTTGYYSPISRPEDTGIIDILCRVDEKGGPIVKFLQSLKPGASALMKGMGGLKIIRQPSVGWFYLDRQVRRLSLLCGGTGLAPAVQIARAFVHGVETGTLSTGAGESEQPGLKIVYAAESTLDLAFIVAFDMLKERYPGLISYYLVLNNPPPGWTQGVGFVDQDCIRQNLWFPPKADHLLVMCGPPIFEKIMCGNLSKLGYPREQYYSFADDPNN